MLISASLVTLAIVLQGVFLYRANQRTSAALDHSAEIAKKQLRAYVAATGSTMQFDPGSGVVHLRVSIKNCGQTPARKLTAISKMFIGPPDSPGPFELAGFTLAPKSNAVLGPGLEMQYELDEPVLPQAISDVTDKKSGLWYYGIVTYEDVFGDLHQTDFRFISLGQGGSPDGLYHAHDGNDIR